MKYESPIKDIDLPALKWLEYEGILSKYLSSTFGGWRNIYIYIHLYIYSIYIYLLSQWLTFKLLGITCLVGNIKSKLLFHCPKCLSEYIYVIIYIFIIHPDRCECQWGL